MMDLSKGPMAALPGGLFLELSQREALEVVPAAVEDLCVLLLPDLDMRLLAGVLHWMVAPGSLATALDHANVAPADRDDYGDVAAAPAAAAGGVAPKVFPFQVVGLARGTLAKDLCMSTLLPSATQKRQGETGLPEPVVMLALAPPTSASVNGAAGAPDLAKSVKALLASVSLDQLYLGDKSSAPTHDGYSGAPLSTSLDAVASVISGKSAVTPALKSPLFWFVCAPAVVDGGDMAGTSSADVSSDDPVVSVLRPEAVGKRALGPILVRLAEENIDLTSIRMLFPSAEHYERSRSFTTAVVAGGYPIIVVGSRGHKAVQRWSEAVGPEDPFVAKRTDPATLRAKYGVDRKRNLMSCSRSAERNRRESQWYFSLSHDVELDEDTCAAVLPPIPMMVPYPVIATTLVLRAGVPGSFVAKVVSCCLQNGFRLSAFRRSTLEPSVSRHVGLPAWINIRGTTPPPVCLQLTAENAVARLIRLGPMLSRMAEESGVVSQVEDTCTLTPPPKQPSHRAAGAKEVFETFVNVLAIARTLEGAQRCGVHLDLNQGPECVDRVRSSSRLADMPSRFAVNKELPQAVCVVITPDAVTDAVAMSHIFEALFINTNAELLGAKLLTWLPEHVSAEMCPFPKDHYMRDDFLEHMEAGPAFVIAMRMVDGLERILDIVGPLPGTGALAMLEGKEATRRGGPASPAQTLRAKFAVDGVRCAVVPSSDAKHALRLMACIFEEDELSWPPSAHGAGAMVPPPASDDVIEALKAEADGPPVLHTVALVKPDARHNFAKILKYVRRGEFKIVGAKMLAPSQVPSCRAASPRCSPSLLHFAATPPCCTALLHRPGMPPWV
jgi:nucleoside diphosphate kinase